MTPVEVTWIAGDDHGLVWPDGLALVDGDLELSVAEQLWSVMSDGSDLAGFLEGLSTACGGLLAIPGFAIGLRLSDGVHFAVRGDFRVHATDAAGEPLDISGGEAVTWSERLVPGTVAFMLSGPADAEGVARRLANGVVPASRLTSGLRTGQDAEGARDDLVESPETSEPVGRALEDEGLVVGFPGNEDLGATAAPNDLDVTRLPEDDLVTLLPGELDVDGPIPGAFDDLWDATIARSVEEAAVRNAGEEHTSAGVPNRPSGPGAPSPGTPRNRGSDPGDGLRCRSMVAQRRRTDLRCAGRTRRRRRRALAAARQARRPRRRDHRPPGSGRPGPGHQRSTGGRAPGTRRRGIRRPGPDSCPCCLLQPCSPEPTSEHGMPHLPGGHPA